MTANRVKTERKVENAGRMLSIAEALQLELPPKDEAIIEVAESKLFVDPSLANEPSTDEPSVSAEIKTTAIEQQTDADYFKWTKSSFLLDEMSVTDPEKDFYYIQSLMTALLTGENADKQFAILLDYHILDNAFSSSLKEAVYNDREWLSARLKNISRESKSHDLNEIYMSFIVCCVQQNKDPAKKITKEDLLLVINQNLLLKKHFHRRKSLRPKPFMRLYDRIEYDWLHFYDQPITVTSPLTPTASSGAYTQQFFKKMISKNEYELAPRAKEAFRWGS